MAQTSINIRMDSDLKAQFSAFCEEVGLSMSSAFCLFAKAAVRQQKIPFEIAADPFYSEANLARLRRAAAEMDAGMGNIHELIEVDDD